MSKSTHKATERLVRTVVSRLSENKQLRRTLTSGRIHVDRQLPFTCVYRQPSERPDTGTGSLVKAEASYLVSSDEPAARQELRELVTAVAETMSQLFGAFLIVEVWAGRDGGRANNPAVPSVLPTFRIVAPKSARLTKTVEAITARLQEVKILKQGVEVEVVRDGVTHPPDMRPLIVPAEAKQLHVSTIGIEVPPVYRDDEKGKEFPSILRDLRRSLSLALRQGFYEFAQTCTTHRPHHYHSLGRKAVVKAVWQVDEQLAEVSNAFDYLLQLTPVNSFAAWKEFKREQCKQAPEFHYRPLPIDPPLLKRKLFAIPIERIEDPTLHDLFCEKRGELERKLTMLEDRDTPCFVYGSLQLFGAVDEPLLRLAQELLQRVSTKATRSAKGDSLTPQEFADLASKDIAFYHKQDPGFKGRAIVTKDVAGILVSRGRLLIDSNMSISQSRVDALLAHEVGTHLLTYYNGRAQPFRQLYSGLAGYEELQEGLAVLSEYLVGGLDNTRLRQLAARVISAQMMLDGATFVDVFQELRSTYKFQRRPAFNIALRIYRGGGLTKDIVYLRGLTRVLKYLQWGGELDPLWVGRIAEEHIPLIRELQYRHVLGAAPVKPRYLSDKKVSERLEALRSGKHTVLDLIDA